MPRNNVKLGQNFLIDDFVIAKISEHIIAQKCDNYVEIGPGRGALTSSILMQIKQLTAIEIDTRLLPELQQLATTGQALDIINADVMHVDFNTILASGAKNNIFGNLPYQIATPLILKLRYSRDLIDSMVFMVQTEVAQRISAKVASSSYGRLAVMTQAWCNIKTLLLVEPSSFSPAPKVMSTVFLAQPKPICNATADLDWLLFEKVVAKAFQHKRKMCFKAFQHILNFQDWHNLGLQPSWRPSDISVAKYIELTNYLKDLGISTAQV